MKKMIITFLLVALAGACIYLLWQSDHKVEAEKIAFMQSKDNFSPEEVDTLWRWYVGKDSTFAPSKEFNELYEKKIKPLPGGKGK